MPRHRSPTTDPHLAAALVRAREAAAKTQAEAAEAAGVHVTTIGNWEAGRTEPGWSQVMRLAAFYGTTVQGLTPHV